MGVTEAEDVRTATAEMIEPQSAGDAGRLSAGELLGWWAP